jgi:hypothetical protein
MSAGNPLPGVTRTQAERFALDLVERVGWTAAEAALGVLTVEAAGWPAWIAVPVGTGVAALKGIVAKHLGRKGTASTAPGV